jgi:hypothetical protein
VVHVGAHNQGVKQAAGRFFLGVLQRFHAQSAFFGGKGEQTPVVAFYSQDLRKLLADFTSSASILSGNGDDGVHPSTPCVFEMYIIIQIKLVFVNTFAQIFSKIGGIIMPFVRKESL